MQGSVVLFLLLAAAVTFFAGTRAPAYARKRIPPARRNLRRRY